jgi:major intracellular serine protease
MPSTNINENQTKTTALSGRKKYFNQGYRGAGINVCVIDTGVNNHIEFGTRLLVDKCKNFCTSASISSEIFDESATGHGTHVASLIAGKNCGIAPEANIISYKVIGGDGGASVPDIISALNYIYTEGYKYIDIVNMSLGGGKTVYNLTGEYEDAINHVVLDRQIPIIVAAGNSGKEEYLYPAGFQEVITVGAVDINRKIALFSTSSDEVDIAQIGVDVWGAWYKGGYIQMTGTSMASPYACGIGALLLCKYKKMFGKNMPELLLYEMMKMNTIDIIPLGVDKNTGAGFCTLGDGVMSTYRKASNQMVVNGSIGTMDASILYQNGRMFSPARFIAEPMNGEVFWDNSKPDYFDVIS